MKNIIITGSGRSGTSMVAGTLARSGYFMGEHLWDARESNPKGFFEDREVNYINEDILGSVVPSSYRIMGFRLFPGRFNKGQRWLSVLPVDVDIQSDQEINDRIKNITSHEPFCFKDPRFAYTLRIWRPFLENTVFICVFRDPATTALSIVKECRTADYLKNISINYSRALNIWESVYNHIDKVQSHHGKWLFIHYNQVFTDEGASKIESFTGARVDRSFPDRGLNRTLSKSEPLPGDISVLYEKMCELANYEDKQVAE